MSDPRWKWRGDRVRKARPKRNATDTKITLLQRAIIVSIFAAEYPILGGGGFLFENDAAANDIAV